MNNWIPITEKLPPPFKDVLVVYKNTHGQFVPIVDHISNNGNFYRHNYTNAYKYYFWKEITLPTKEQKSLINLAHKEVITS